jgi:hypothetical protein
VEGFILVNWNDISERIRKIFRAKLGLPLDDDVYQGMIHTNDDRERTKLNNRNVYRHNYLDILSLVGGEEWKIAGQIAEGERHLFISEDGQRATDFINAIVHKQQEQVPVTNITMQNQPPNPEPEKKKGWFRR